MNIDLKKTKTSREETFLHLTTMLGIMYGNAREEYRQDRNVENETERQFDRALKKEKKKLKEAEIYLRSYLEELIKQKLI